jgi:hypothetical protein
VSPPIVRLQLVPLSEIVRAIINAPLSGRTPAAVIASDPQIRSWGHEAQCRFPLNDAPNTVSTLCGLPIIEAPVPRPLIAWEVPSAR